MDIYDANFYWESKHFPGTCPRRIFLALLFNNSKPYTYTHLYIQNAAYPADGSPRQLGEIQLLL